MKIMRTAIYPGSFNPIHEGHQQVIDLALQIFDKVIVIIAVNPKKEKPNIDDFSNRKELIESIYGDKVKIICYYGLVGQFAKENDACIIKGVRNFIDFQNELDQASFNRSMFGVETILVPSAPELNFISSTLMRELKTYNKE